MALNYKVCLLFFTYSHMLSEIFQKSEKLLHKPFNFWKIATLTNILWKSKLFWFSGNFSEFQSEMTQKIRSSPSFGEFLIYSSKNFPKKLEYSDFSEIFRLFSVLMENSDFRAFRLLENSLLCNDGKDYSSLQMCISWRWFLQAPAADGDLQLWDFQQPGFVLFLCPAVWYDTYLFWASIELGYRSEHCWCLVQPGPYSLG